MKHIRTALLLIALLLPLGAAASFVDGGKREFPLYCNGVPCVIDTATRNIYCSVIRPENDSVKLVFSSDTIGFLRINYRRYKMGDTVRLSNKFSLSYTTYVGTSFNRWKLWLTSLPIVMIEASRYEKGVYHHGYMFVIDPLRRTKGKALFSHFVGVKIRGGYTAGLAKKPYGIKLWDSHREGKNVSVLGLRKDDNLILDAMYNDPARMRNRLCADLWNRVDSLPYEVAEGHSRLNATEGRFVEVFVDGCYNGLYCLTDKINRKKLDLVKVETDESGKLTHHGVLYKSYDWTDETRFQNVNMSAGIENTLVWRGWEQKYPDDSAAESCWKPLRDLISFTAKKTNPNSYNFAAYLRAKYYLQNIVDYALFVNVLNLGDNVCKNLFVSFRDVDTTSPKALLTPWDLDCSLGRSWDGSKAEDVGFTDHMLAADIIGRPILTGPYYYRTRIRDTWERWKRGPFSVDSVSARIKAYNNLFETSGARTRESARWPSSVAARITEQSYMIDWYKRSVAAADKFFEGFPSGIEEVRDAVTFVISSAGGHISVGGSGTARLSLCTGDGILLTDGDISLPYTTATLSRGLYIVTVRRGQTVTRRKVLVR